MQAVVQTFEGDEARKHSPRRWVMVPLISFIFKQRLEVESMGPSCTVHTRRERESLNGKDILTGKGEKRRKRFACSHLLFLP